MKNVFCKFSSQSINCWIFYTQLMTDTVWEKIHLLRQNDNNLPDISLPKLTLSYKGSSAPILISTRVFKIGIHNQWNNCHTLLDLLQRYMKSIEWIPFHKGNDCEF